MPLFKKVFKKKLQIKKSEIFGNWLKRSLKNKMLRYDIFKNNKWNHGILNEKSFCQYAIIIQYGRIWIIYGIAGEVIIFTGDNELGEIECLMMNRFISSFSPSFKTDNFVIFIKKTSLMGLVIEVYITILNLEEK